jgi:Arc/MetJ family transcription regulator
VIIDIDESLITEAMKYTGISTKEAVVEEALRTLVSLKAQEQIRELRGKLKWEGDLNKMRDVRFLRESRSNVETEHVDH